VTEAKEFRYAVFRSAGACWSTTADTSLGQARSGVALATVSRALSIQRHHAAALAIG